MILSNSSELSLNPIPFWPHLNLYLRQTILWTFLLSLYLEPIFIIFMLLVFRIPVPHSFAHSIEAYYSRPYQFCSLFIKHIFVKHAFSLSSCANTNVNIIWIYLLSLAMIKIIENRNCRILNWTTLITRSQFCKKVGVPHRNQLLILENG